MPGLQRAPLWLLFFTCSCSVLKNILTYNKELPFDVQPVPLRRILAPDEEENLEFEEDEEEGGAGAGSQDSFPARVPDLNGIDLTPVQDTPVASRKEDTYVHFNVDIELQKHVEKLTKGAAVFFEFKHYKPKKRFTSIKYFTFMEMDEVKPRPTVIQLYKKPTDFKTKKLQLLPRNHFIFTCIKLCIRTNTHLSTLELL